MKIIAINGSPRGDDSITQKAIISLFNTIERISNCKIQYETVWLNDYKLNNCAGCLSCFIRSDTCSNFNDGIKSIEDKISNADIVVFASPVYAHNVTGIMKTFLDRISYGLHIMKFLGKYGIIITTSGSNGNQFVAEYLNKIMMYLGIKVINSISIVEINGDGHSIANVAQEIVNIIDGKAARKTYEYEEEAFQNMKNLMRYAYKKNNKNKAGEYWLKQGYFNYDSFEALFNDNIKTNK